MQKNFLDIMNSEEIENKLREIGLKAAINAPRVKLYAKVNSEDNFSLYIFNTIDTAVMNEICDKTISSDKEINRKWAEWYNSMFDKNTKKFDKFIMDIGREAYKKIREKI